MEDKTRIIEPPADPKSALLADSLEVLRLRSQMLGSLFLKSPWAIRFPGSFGWVHVVGESCGLKLQQREEAVVASAGDLLIVFPGNEHRLGNRSDHTAIAFDDLLGSFQHGGIECALHESGPLPAPVICGCFILDGLERTPLHASLPALIHVKGARQRPLPYIEYLLRLIFLEMASLEPCAPLIINRLIRMLLIKAVQAYMSTMDERHGNWLCAITDPDIGRALALMHDQPEAPWTVASLAERVAMSRSAFSARFTALVGRPPLEYLCEWRMQKASYLLRTTRAELKDISAKVGYESASAFSKAFARWAGVAPGVYRQTHSKTAFASVAAILPFTGSSPPL